MALIRGPLIDVATFPTPHEAYGLCAAGLPQFKAAGLGEVFRPHRPHLLSVEPILVLHERKTSFIFMAKLKHGKKAKPVAQEVVRMLYAFRKQTLTITTDNGPKFSAHEDITAGLRIRGKQDVTVYFADSYCSWQQGEFVLNEAFREYNNLYYFGKKKYLLEITRDNFSLMFYELIINARNSLYFDHSEIASRAVAKLTIHANNRFYSDDPAVFQYVVNRAEMLYIVRDITLKASKPYSHEDIEKMTSVEVPIKYIR